jgi:hypothetical protein
MIMRHPDVEDHVPEVFPESSDLPESVPDLEFVSVLGPGAGSGVGVGFGCGFGSG